MTAIHRSEVLGKLEVQGEMHVCFHERKRSDEDVDLGEEALFPGGAEPIPAALLRFLYIRFCNINFEMGSYAL